MVVQKWLLRHIKNRKEGIDMKLGFIGLGNMAKAMIGGILKKEVVPATDIMGCAKSEASKEYASGNWGILIGDSGGTLCGDSCTCRKAAGSAPGG